MACPAVPRNAGDNLRHAITQAARCDPRHRIGDGPLPLGLRPGRLIRTRARPAPAPQAQPLIVTHRGGPEGQAEGSLETLRRAADNRFAVEFDLRPLRDGAWAVAHDDTTDRILRDHRGPISDLDTQQWKASCVVSAEPECQAPAVWADALSLLPPDTRLVPEIKQRGISVGAMVRAIDAAGLATA